MKKFLLRIGGILSVALPLVTIVSCENNDDNDIVSSDQKSVNAIKLLFKGFAMQTTKAHAAVAAKTALTDITSLTSFGDVIIPNDFKVPIELSREGVAITFELEEIKDENKTYLGTITFTKNDVIETQEFTVTKKSEGEANVYLAMTKLNGLFARVSTDVEKITMTKFDEKNWGQTNLKLFKNNMQVVSFPILKNVIATFEIPTTIKKPKTDKTTTVGKAIITITSNAVTRTYDLPIKWY